MMRIAIVDDDLIFASTVRARIEAYFTARGEPVHIWCGDGITLLGLLGSQQNFGLYLLDVKMPEINGLDLARKIGSFHPKAKILLLTSYDSFALAGIRLGVYYYILKDNYWPELSLILERIRREEEEEREEYYFIATETSAYKVSLNQILYLTKEKKYTLFHCLDDTQYRERDSLGAVFGRLPQNRFLAINRGMVVNMKHIVSIKGLNVQLRNEEILPISRYEKAQVLDRLADYWRKT